ncbi:EAL domain-containing protein [Azospirillum sp. SYSU D00513]|uniref:bifunctional diguanylate cyclase/phosphodiesterase n=1 Tax=Azospirillum sp. SYSU D00513 TaxID=2812561 RepID=UPI001A968EE8|nr:EAL domain-containing protein [Azospirillum sp. SYSU D00513]
MLHVYACITQQHDPWLLLLAAAVCGFGAWVSLSLVTRAAGAAKRMRGLWIAAAASATGGGIWATHFVAMLAFRSGLTVGYDVLLTALSIVIAVVGSGAGIAVAIGRGAGMRGAALGGGIVGAVTGAMHYTGMAALQAPADHLHDARFIAASLAIGILFGAAAMAVSLRRTSLRARALGAMLLVAAICGLHFTGMTAVTLVPNPLATPSGQAMAPEWLAVAVAAIATLIMGLGLVGSILDQRLADRASRETARLRSSEERFRQLADATFEGIVIHRDGRVLDVNRAMTELLGRSPEQVIGRHLAEFVAPGQRDAIARYHHQPSFGRLEVELLHSDGTLIVSEAHGHSITQDGLPARVVAIRDIRERKRSEERIRHMANHDLLTGLPNRSLFLDRAGMALANARHDGEAVAVFHIGLDRFKTVNDLHGHKAGDALLRQAAARILDTVRKHDTVARLGGDEFVVLQTLNTPLDDAMLLAERLVQALAAPFELEDGPQPALAALGASVGIALFPQDGEDAEQLLAHAGAALSRAKSDGRGAFRFYEAAMDERIQARRRLERDLRAALETDALCVHYQPQVDCGTQRLLGFEALVRWNHPERGMVPPSEFIPLAEESGLIGPLGERVLRSACREAASWPDGIVIAVNLSPVQFRQPDIAASILAILRETGFPPERLEIEVTEGVLIDDTERALAALNALKMAGVRIALDDFGTGYSSLSYLQRFAFDKLKIDRSFVSTMETSQETRSIVRTILALAKALDITVTAEGVETEEQLRILQEEACNQVQGYLIGRPAAPEGIRHFGLSPAAGMLEAAAGA